MKHIPQESYSYGEYMEIIEKLVAENKTSGPEQSSFLSSVTALNLVRMKRIGKTFQLLPRLEAALSALDGQFLLIGITEAWCGDAAQILPVVDAMTLHARQQIDLQLVFRDDHLSYMNQYLTNGSKSIPKLILYDIHHQIELGNWGPRPAVLQDYIQSLQNEGLSKEEWVEKVMLWYTKDRTQHIQEELATFIEGVNKRMKAVNGGEPDANKNPYLA